MMPFHVVKVCREKKRNYKSLFLLQMLDAKSFFKPIDLQRIQKIKAFKFEVG